MEEQPMHEIRTAEPAGYAEFLAELKAADRESPAPGIPGCQPGARPSFFIGKSVAKFFPGRTAKTGVRRSSSASPPT
jgi:hypothetical protein